MRILVTGASGFVGRPLCRHLLEQGHSVIPATRDTIGDLGANPPWDTVLPGVDVVVHLAALVHQMGAAKPGLDDYNRVNATATGLLAQACVRHGVRRLVFLSSVKVNGECSAASPFTETAQPRPEDPYGVSKLNAEHALAAIAQTGRLETTIVRPPLVYGPGVRANFLRLLNLVHRMNPLLVPTISSRRSFVGIGNLVDLLTRTLSHPAAANQTFLVSDNEDVTAAELMQRMAKTMGHRSFVAPVPESALRLAARLLGAREVMKRIVDPLQVSPAKALRLLDWQPPFTLDAGLALTVDWYRRAKITV